MNLSFFSSFLFKYIPVDAARTPAESALITPFHPTMYVMCDQIFKWCMLNSSSSSSSGLELFF